MQVQREKILDAKMEAERVKLGRGKILLLGKSCMREESGDAGSGGMTQKLLL